MTIVVPSCKAADVRRLHDAPDDFKHFMAGVIDTKVHSFEPDPTAPSSCRCASSTRPASPMAATSRAVATPRCGPRSTVCGARSTQARTTRTARPWRSTRCQRPSPSTSASTMDSRSCANTPADAKLLPGSGGRHPGSLTFRQHPGSVSKVYPFLLSDRRIRLSAFTDCDLLPPPSCIRLTARG